MTHAYEPGARVIVDRGVRKVRAEVVYDRGTATVRIRTEDGKQSSVKREKVRLVVQEAPKPAKLTRRPSSTRPATKPQPKQKIVRSDEYLDYVRSHPCMACGTTEDVQAHHWAPRGKGGGMGIKADDFCAVPLCAEHHGYWHQHARLPMWGCADTKAAMTEELFRMLHGWAVRRVEEDAA